MSVVVDAVNPVPEARAGWRDLASRTGSRLVVLETVIGDPEEHQRRVAARKPDLAREHWLEPEGVMRIRSGMEVTELASAGARELGLALIELADAADRA